MYMIKSYDFTYEKTRRIFREREFLPFRFRKGKTLMKKYLWLLGINLFISAFTFGGGYVVIPMLRKYFVEKARLFPEDELLNMAAIAQSSPGAIAVNITALAGYRVAGLSGLTVSWIAAVLPPLAILALVSFWYAEFRENPAIAAVLKGMEAGVAALIVDLVVDMYKLILQERSAFFALLAPAAFAANFFLNVNVALILLAGCLLCLLRLRLKGVRK